MACLTESVVLPASSLEGRGAFTLKSMGPRACAGLAAGADSINPKRWVCEDTVLLARLDQGGWLAAVADAHWGGLSGEVAVRSVLDAWQRASASVPAARLSEALRAVEARLKERGADES